MLLLGDMDSDVVAIVGSSVVGLCNVGEDPSRWERKEGNGGVVGGIA
jgi:hypothetical protein